MAEFFDRELREVARGGPDADQLAAKVAADVTRLKHDDRKRMTDARDQVLTAMGWGQRTVEERMSVSFEKYQADFGPALVEAYADSLGVGEACRRRGIVGLLKRRALEFFVGTQASWIYAMSVPSAGGLDTRQVHRNDGYDDWHALEASAGRRHLRDRGQPPLEAAQVFEHRRLHRRHVPAGAAGRGSARLTARKLLSYSIPWP
jgi:hypothetical protein